ncbi:MAG: AmmeMemoRadiSam system protein B [Thermoplasmata archaeon]|nr:AmmeMemoRadiSam system protein B [Thermoplasmata archaeon]
MREPAVAGQFYPLNQSDLEIAIKRSFLDPIGPGKIPSLSEIRMGRILGGIVPHAGYIYSGPVAAHFYHEMALDGFPETFIIIGPNHTGYGSLVSVSLEDYKTPFGIVKVDKEIANKIHRDIVDIDPLAHKYEHSIEVQLPFLQFFKKEIKIVPIVMMAQDYEFAKLLSEIIKDSIKGKDVVIIASSDFSHYVPKRMAYENDAHAINAILKNDIKGFYNAISTYDLSICGYGPIATMLMTTNSHPKLLKYSTSGDVFPMDEVVGYASFKVER